MGDALGADIENQRLTAGAAGVEARQPAGIVGAQRVAVRANQRLGQKG